LKAEQIAKVLGEKSEIYLGICDTYLFSTSNDIIDMILQDPSIIEKHSSYLWIDWKTLTSL